MQEENIEKLFSELSGSFDIEAPLPGHRERFLDKLKQSDGVVVMERKKSSWWKPLSIAASFAILCTIGFGLLNSNPTIEEQVAKISPEASETQFYFASLIEQQVQELERKGTPDTQKMIDDTLLQMKKLESAYGNLEQDLLDGGNSKLILSAMITNFQTRIELLQEVMNKIDNINNSNTFDDENFTI
ncbi:MAG TPA: hypothetical protein VKN36_07520 [Eudoraea sp.]|nr:hypothetical protein [Eudoraea sp.]